MKRTVELARSVVLKDECILPESGWWRLIAWKSAVSLYNQLICCDAPGSNFIAYFCFNTILPYDNVPMKPIWPMPRLTAFPCPSTPRGGAGGVTALGPGTQEARGWGRDDLSFFFGLHLILGGRYDFFLVLGPNEIFAPGPELSLGAPAHAHPCVYPGAYLPQSCSKVEQAGTAAKTWWKNWNKIMNFRPHFMFQIGWNPSS